MNRDEFDGMSDADLIERLSELQDELEREWCGTLILVAIEAIKREQENRRKKHQPWPS